MFRFATFPAPTSYTNAGVSAVFILTRTLLVLGMGTKAAPEAQVGMKICPFQIRTLRTGLKSKQILYSLCDPWIHNFSTAAWHREIEDVLWAQPDGQAPS